MTYLDEQSRYRSEQGRPEPPVAGDEAAILLGFLERQCATFAWKCGGLERPDTGATDSQSESPSLRHILLNMIEEYARHNGHADLIRESVDGLVGQDPPG